MAFDFLNSLASQSFLDGNEDVGVDSGDELDIDVELETEREAELDLSDDENNHTGPQPSDTREWSEALEDVTVEGFTSFTGSVIDFDTLSSPLEVFDHYFPPSLFELLADQTNLYAVS